MTRSITAIDTFFPLKDPWPIHSALDYTTGPRAAASPRASLPQAPVGNRTSKLTCELLLLLGVSRGSAQCSVCRPSHVHAQAPDQSSSTSCSLRASVCVGQHVLVIGPMREGGCRPILQKGALSSGVLCDLHRMEQVEGGRGIQGFLLPPQAVSSGRQCKPIELTQGNGPLGQEAWEAPASGQTPGGQPSLEKVSSCYLRRKKNQTLSILN